MKLEKEKRMVDTYEVLQAIHIGDKEVLLCEDKNAESQYMTCFSKANELFETYSEGMGSEDYLEILELFCDRVKGQIEQVRAERTTASIITPNMCLPLSSADDICGKVVAMKADCLHPEYRSAEYQLFLVSRGNGAVGNARGTAVYCHSLSTGEHTRFERYDVQGVIKPEHMPQWAKEGLAKVQEKKQKERSSRDSR